MEVTNLKLEVVKQRMEVIQVPEKLPTIADKRTGAKSIYFPFKFGDGKPGHLILTKGIKTLWEPSEDIVSITIKFR